MCKSQSGSHGTVPRTLTKRSARSRAQRRGRWVPPPHSRSAVRVRGGAVKVRRAAFAGRAGTRGGDSQQPGQPAEARGRGKPDRDASSGDGFRAGFRGGRRSSRSPGGSRGSSQDDRDERGAETGAPGCGARGSGRPGSRLADPWLSGRRDAFPSTGPRAAGGPRASARRFRKGIDTVPPDSCGECSGFGSG